MTRIKIEDIIDHLSDEIKKALADSLKEHFPTQAYDVSAVFRTFKRKIATKCSTWESVPDRYIKSGE